jgi:murein DD-endopeptidase MepM/ murein hydrolase activator NlpD
MLRRRYTVLIADRTTGVVRRLTISLRAVAAVALGLVSVPVLLGMGAQWRVWGELSALRTHNRALLAENTNFRVTTGELTTQIQSLGTVIEDLGVRSALDPDQARAIQKLPAVVKSRAMGGTSQTQASEAISSILATSLTSPEDTFGVLRTLLRGLEARLSNVRRDVERQEALAGATPSIWPAHGWLSGTFGRRADPFTGSPAFHQGLDISADRGQPVYATANGTVSAASYSGEYGNLVVLDHEFGLSTRYGHLSKFSVKPGDIVKRGAVIGYVGSTGRSTGSHLHYEVLVNGRLINPLQLLTQAGAR